MKTFALIIATLVALTASTSLQARRVSKELRKEIRGRAVYQARMESRNLADQGYFVAPDALPLEEQIENSWIHQYEMDDEGQPQYIVATATSVGQSQIASRLQATEAAKLEIAGTIASQVSALVENYIANYQLDTEDAVSFTKTVVASKSLIVVELGRTLPLVEIYRNQNHCVETTIRLVSDTLIIKAKVKPLPKKA